MKVFREKKGDTEKSYLPLRKGIVDLKARGKVSQAINSRYANGFADLKSNVRAEKILGEVSQRIKMSGQSIRALEVFGKDAELLQIMSNGEFCIEGFRNKDLQTRLFGNTQDKKKSRSQSAKVSRLLRIMKAHGIIKKFPKSHRYQLTAKGQKLIGMLKGISRHTVESLAKNAA